MPARQFSPLILLIAFSLTAQSQEVHGLIAEESTKEPMEFVSVALINLADSSVVQAVFTDKKGIFRLNPGMPGRFFMKISFLGFETFQTPPFELAAGKSLELGVIPLKMAANELKTVEISAEKSLYSTAIDRKIYRVEKDVLAQSSSAADVLRNLPSVTVDVDGQVSMRGSSNITFFINGKPSALMRANPTAALQNMPANSIEQIEILTNPSAKYRPDGASGIINIVLKKDPQQGFNGSLNATAGNRDRYNAGLNLSYNTGAINLYGSYGFRYANRPRIATSRRIAYDAQGQPIQYYDYSSSAGGRPKSHVLNGGLDWAINRHNKFSLSGNYYHATGLYTSTSTTTFKDGVEQLINAFGSVRTNNERENEYELSAGLEHQFEDEDHTLTLDFNFANYAETEDQFYTDHYSYPAVYDLRTHNLVEKGGPLTELSLEYARPIGEDLELEAGYVYEPLRDNIRFLGERFEEQTQHWLTLPERSNDFIFNQKIHALYVTLGQEMEAFSYLAGLRAEQVFVRSELVFSDSIVPNNYFRLYPTLHLAYTLTDAIQLQLNYSRRVNRADSDEQNPFVEYSDPRNGEAGNPRLKPEQTHSVELGLQWRREKVTITPTLFYRYEYDAFGEIDRYVNDSTVITTFENLNSSQSAGLEVILSGKPAEWLNINFNANGFYQQLDAGNLGLSAKHNSLTWDAKLAAGIQLGKTTFVQLNPFFRSARISPQGRYEALFLVNCGARQDLLHRRASLTLSVSDLFNSLKRTSIIDTPALYESAFYRRNSQIIFLGFVFRFGSPARKKEPVLQFEDTI